MSLPRSSQKSSMKILVALAVFFLVSTQLFAEEIGTSDDLNYWSDWSDSDQIKVRPSPRRSSRPWELSLPYDSVLVSLSGTATATRGGGGARGGGGGVRM